MDLTADDESLDINLRDPEVVAIRAVILSALAYRGYLELDEDQDDELGADEDRFELIGWLRDEELIDHVEPTELAMLQAPVGTLDEAEALAATWATEALAPLSWALGLTATLAPPDQPVDVAALRDLLPSPGSPVGGLIGGASLRGEAVIAAARETAELWHWRATVQELLTAAAPADRNDLVTAVQETAAEGAALNILPPPARGDLPVNGQPYALAADHEMLATIAEWRLQALNWLCGFGTSWANVPLDL